ncbi:MAG: hypothetical protein M3247_04045 [Thermoproteota archaeon]|nr:hypothetical protein [Thermoproteota archaeon]
MLINKHRTELTTLPESISSLARYYLTKRLFVLIKKPLAIDRRFGRPIPYLAYWFAMCFGLDDQKIISQLGLTLSYISLAVSARDDLIDGRILLNHKRISEHAHVCLANIYYDKYFWIFTNLIPRGSEFWYLLSRCLNNWSNHESWGFLFSAENKTNSLSEKFLSHSSSYLVAITLPTIAAAAFLTGNQDKIPQITKFLRHYWMGWKIVDDIRDWQKDLDVPNFNHSSVLYYIKSKLDKGSTLNAESVTSMFLDELFIKNVYGAILRWYKAAKRDITCFDSPNLTEFMDSQIEFHTRERDSLLRSKLEFSQRINQILLKAI